MYPVCLDISGKLCIIIGGGLVAERKARGLLNAGAHVRLISPDITGTLAGLVREGKIDWRQKDYAPEDLDKGLLVFAATNDPEIQDRIWKQAAENGQLINVADCPQCCNFQVPALVRRGDLTIAVSTNGKSPAVSAMIRKELQEMYGPEYEILLNIMARIRQQTATESATQVERKKIYKKILHEDIIKWIRAGNTKKLNAHLREVLGTEIDFETSEAQLNS